MGTPESPVQHLQLNERSTVREDDLQVLRSIVSKVSESKHSVIQMKVCLTN